MRLRTLAWLGSCGVVVLAAWLAYATAFGYPPTRADAALDPGQVQVSQVMPWSNLSYSAGDMFLPVLLENYEKLPRTNIVVDGLPEDWIGRSVLHDDTVGDAAGGFLDLTIGYAFVNRHALYIMLECVDPSAQFQLFDVNLEAGDRQLQITWQQGQTTEMQVVDWTSGTGTSLGYVSNTTFAFNEALEIRIDLDDLPSSDGILVTNIRVLAAPGGALESVDEWAPTDEPPAVLEEDPPIVHSEEDPYVLARQFALPDGYIAENMVPAPASGNALARSLGGTVYVLGWRIGVQPYLALLDTATGIQTHLLDLPAHLRGKVIGGPGDTALVQVGIEIWQISPDGTYQKWGESPDAIALAYSPDGRLLGTPHSPRTSLLEILQDGSVSEVASGFSDVFGVVVRSDGVIGLFDVGTGNILRIDADSTQHILVETLEPGETRPLFLDLNESIYSSLGENLVRIDWDTGDLTSYPHDVYRPCIWNPSDYLFVQGNLLIMVGDQMGWADLGAATYGLYMMSRVVTPAAAIGTTGDLYTGTPACGTEYPGQVLHYEPPGDISTILDGLPGGIWDIAFDTSGGLYVATGANGSENRLYYLDPSGAPLTEIASAPAEEIMSLAVDPTTGYLLVSTPGGAPLRAYNAIGQVESYALELPSEHINELRLATSPDGSLYAVATADFHFSPSYIWLLSIDLGAGTTEVVTEFLRETSGGGITNLHVDALGTSWLIVSPDSWLYSVSSEGDISLFAENLPIDTPAIAANSDTGDIYFTHETGIYRIFRDLTQ